MTERHDQSNAELPANWFGVRSLIFTGIGLVLVTLGFATRRFLDSTPPGGSGEFQGINHFAPTLFLGLVCVPGIIIASLAGLGLAIVSVRKLEGMRHVVILAVATNVSVVIGWMIQCGPAVWKFVRLVIGGVIDRANVN